MPQSKSTGNKKKILLMGGTGNQLFQILRARSYYNEGATVELLRLSRHKNFVYRLIGFTNHKDWLDIDSLVFSLGLKVREILFYELLLVAVYYVLKRIGFSGWFDTPLTGKNVPLEIFGTHGIDVGYFQSPKHSTPLAMSQLISVLINELDISSTPQYENI